MSGSSGRFLYLPSIMPFTSATLPTSRNSPISFRVRNPEEPWVPSGRMSKPRLSRVALYPENHLYPVPVNRHTSRAMTAVAPRPKGVNSTNQLRKGLNTQMLSITVSPSLWKVDAVPSRMEFSSIP